MEVDLAVEQESYGCFAFASASACSDRIVFDALHPDLHLAKMSHLRHHSSDEHFVGFVLSSSLPYHALDVVPLP